MIKMSTKGDSLASLRRVGAFIRGASAEAVSGYGNRRHTRVDSARDRRLRPESSAQVMTSLAGTVRPRLNTSNAAFTLIELLAVILIILVLAAAVAAVSSYVMTAAANTRVRTEMAAIEAALESYKSDMGAYPPSFMGNSPNGALMLNAYLTFGNAAQRKIYMRFTPRQVLPSTRVLIDPWGNQYGYRCPAKYNKLTYDLWSYGKDGQNGEAYGYGGTDDITNWK